MPRSCIICKYTVPISRRMNQNYTSPVELSKMFDSIFTMLVIKYHFTLIHAETSHSRRRSGSPVDSRCTPRSRLLSLDFLTRTIAVFYFCIFVIAGLCIATTRQHQNHLPHWLPQPLMECARKRKLGFDKSAGS
jgi:hypothetical protein